MIRNILLVSAILYLINLKYNFSLPEKYSNYNMYINYVIPLIGGLSTFIIDFDLEDYRLLFEILTATVLITQYIVLKGVIPFPFKN